MREAALTPRRVRRFLATTDSAHEEAIYPNLLLELTPTAADQVWVADLTYSRLTTGFVYLAVILDAWSRRVVGYAISHLLDARLCLAALEAALEERRPVPHQGRWGTDSTTRTARMSRRRRMVERCRARRPTEADSRPVSRPLTYDGASYRAGRGYMLCSIAPRLATGAGCTPCCPPSPQGAPCARRGPLLSSSV